METKRKYLIGALVNMTEAIPTTPSMGGEVNLMTDPYWLLNQGMQTLFCYMQ